MKIDDISMIENKPENDDDDNDNDLKEFNALFNIYLSQRQNSYYYEDLKNLLNYKGDNQEFYFCNKCNRNLIFYLSVEELYNLDKLFYSCGCNKGEKFEIFFKDLKNFIKEEKDIKTFINCGNCNEKFNYYCDEHKDNICLKCIVDKKHKGEILKNLDTNYILNRLIYLIKFALPKKSGKENNKILEIKSLIRCIILNYIIYPSYALYQTIINFSKTFDEYSKSNNIGNKNYFKKIIHIIRQKNELFNLTKDKYPYVDRINLFRQKFFDLEKLNVFENLTDLNLTQNCINSLSPLLNAKFKNLQFLNLYNNILNDNDIEIIEKLDLKELVKLNLGYNYFTKFELLLAIGDNKKGSFKKLEILDISFNILRTKKNNQKKQNKKWKTLNQIVNELKNLDFKSIKFLSATNGVFTQKTAEFIIPALNLTSDAIQNLDLRYNNLTDINFLGIKNEEFENIKDKNRFIVGNLLQKNSNLYQIKVTKIEH